MKTFQTNIAVNGLYD